METFKGKVQKIIFEREGFYIFSFLAAGNRTFKAKGTFLGTQIRVHQELLLRGVFEKTKYGEDLNVKEFEEIQPSDVAGITNYLTANVKGVGWATAQRIANYFGADTVKVLTEDPDRVMSLDFLSDDQRNEIHKSLTANRSYRDVAVFLMSFDVSPTIVQRIYEKFGNEAKEKLTDNPYRLTTVRGIGFKKADEIAIRMGIDPKSPLRIQAVIKYILNEQIGVSGHLFIPMKELAEMAKELVGPIDIKVWRTCAEELSTTGEIVVDGQRVYGAQSYHVEVNSALKLSSFFGPVKSDFDLETFVADYERANSTPGRPFKLSDEQLQAVELALTSKVVVITGLPGTGKTTVLKAIVKMFEEMDRSKGFRVALMTPTGVSSKRLRAATGRPAGTIHRTLGCRGDAGWTFNASNPLRVDGVLVDEVSMVDQALFYRFLDGIPNTARLVLVGDDAQLPSVGPGNVLRELINSGCVPTVKLTKIHRQEEASDIVLNAHRVNRGEKLEINTTSKDTDFKFFSLDNEDQILDRIRYLARGLKDRGLEFQVLSPRHKGTLGVENLNNKLREDLNPDHGQDSVIFKTKSFRVGDRVMVTRNNYDKGVFNGDIGAVTKIDRGNKTIQFQVEGNSEPTVFEYSDAMEDLVLAYCVTVHKSQGSEWQYIIMPMVKSFSIQLQRNLFYTALTRARKKVMVLGQMIAIDRAINNNKVIARNTVFGERLSTLMTMN